MAHNSILGIEKYFRDSYERYPSVVIYVRGYYLNDPRDMAKLFEKIGEYLSRNGISSDPRTNPKHIHEDRRQKPDSPYRRRDSLEDRTNANHEPRSPERSGRRDKNIQRAAEIERQYENDPRIRNDPKYRKRFLDSVIKEYQNYRDDVDIKEVSSGEMPRGYLRDGTAYEVKGYYDPNEHKARYSGKDYREKEFVRKHETWHSRGFHSERLVDDLTAAKLGYRLAGRERFYNNNYANAA